MTTWSIGYADSARLFIELLSPPAVDCGYDWISARATIDVGGFHGVTQLMITLADLIRFRDNIRRLYKELKGEAEFTTIEQQISFTVTTDRLGHMNVSGYLADDPSFGNKLTYSIGIDQTFLQKTISELEECIRISEKAKGEQGVSGYGAERAAPKR